jgi:hypothetical protein
MRDIRRRREEVKIDPIRLDLKHSYIVCVTQALVRVLQAKKYLSLRSSGDYLRGATIDHLEKRIRLEPVRKNANSSAEPFWFFFLLSSFSFFDNPFPLISIFQLCICAPSMSP